MSGPWIDPDVHWFALPDGSGNVIDLKPRGAHGIVAHTDTGKKFYIAVNGNDHFCTEVTEADLRNLDASQ